MDNSLVADNGKSKRVTPIGPLVGGIVQGRLYPHSERYRRVQSRGGELTYSESSFRHKTDRQKDRANVGGSLPLL